LTRRTSINSISEIHKEKEMADFRRLFYAFALVALLAGLTVPASAQLAPFQCQAATGVPPTIRAEGLTELMGDLVLSCSGGVPTPAGQVVQPVNITVTLNTNLTSRLLSGGLWSEALVIIDEPHSAFNPTRPILNCGNTGALDSGPSGANVCAIYATADPSKTYDGTPNGYSGTCSNGTSGLTCASTGGTFVSGTCNAATTAIPAANSYGCGRPNVFQGRLGTVQDVNQYNAVTWLGIPLDPPGTTSTRTIRITNIRGDGSHLGIPAAGNYYLNYAQEQISINGNTSLSLNNSQQIVAYVQQGLIAGVARTNFNFLQCVGENEVTGSTGLIGETTGTFPLGTNNIENGHQTTGSSPQYTFTEGFGSSWKAKNISEILGPGANGGTLGNGQIVTAASYWSYDGSTTTGTPTINHPVDVNQNVPGAIYNTESGFEYQPGLLDPTPDPPFGIGTSTVTGTGLATAFHNSTLIDNAGVADQGTRLMFQVQTATIVPGTNILVPDALFLTNGTTTASCVTCTGISGIAMLVTTDQYGAGAYAPVYTGTSAVTAATTFSAISSTGVAVYEVIFADPFSIESATLTAVVTYAPQLNLNEPTPGTTTTASGGFAPAYGASSPYSQTAHYPEPQGGTPNLPIPRFVPSSIAPASIFSVGKCACNLLFPFVSSSGGYDTGIAIANTSMDNLGFNGTSAALSQFGGVQFWYYGQGANGGTPPPSQCTNTTTPGVCPPNVSSTTPLVAAGQVLTYVLSSGGGSIGSGPNGLTNSANGFSGYIIAQAQFQYCHAYAFITAVGAGPLSQAVSEGYLGLILDNKSWNCTSYGGLCRTNQNSENLVH
jgi:hypothetical protein